jgi:hypothetical protein
VEGIELPKRISILFDNDQQIDLLAIDNQEVTITGITFEVNNFYLNVNDDAADVRLIMKAPPANEGIMLADSTQINFYTPRQLFSLFFYKEQERWVMRHSHSDRFYFQVKLPGESEFKKYTSITFRKDWGEFTEGVLFEGK